MSDASADELEFEQKNQLLHVIYENGDFRPDLKEAFERWAIADMGFKYKVCGVLGPQSSGKSVSSSRGVFFFLSSLSLCCC